MKRFTMNFTHKAFSKKMHQTIRTSSIFVALLILLSACQLNNIETKNTLHEESAVSYADYYLWLKSLSSAELIVEIKQLKTKLLPLEDNSNKKYAYESKLMLIYSLPNPAVYRPYQAKTLLNKYPLPEHISNKEDDNLAFMVMLRDQLNSQLYLLNKDKEQEKIARFYIEQLKKKEAEIIRLKKQLAQLKAIEQSISGHSETTKQ